MRIAIIGASGFVGLRLVERLHLEGRAEVVPIAHAYRSLAVLARFALPWKVADATDTDALAEALKGCDAVVHAALGNAPQIVAMAEALYPAAERAGIKRIVALSSAAVHSLTPVPGTDENTPILTAQKSEYNVAKARAELLLTRARRKGRVELVQLRPSIIHGPRSRLVPTSPVSCLPIPPTWSATAPRSAMPSPSTTWSTPSGSPSPPLPPTATASCSTTGRR
ncbi:MAG: NAD(P)-dependent oxidoreductase [Opitutaceae bacterium]|nr:NAD(P)-dependent oxidoreductase [Opitutaceae bacterium]